MKQQEKVFMIVGSTAVLVAAGVTGVWLFGKSDTATSSSTISTAAGQTATTAQAATTTASVASQTSSSTMMSSSMTCKDGTYKTTISYSVPHGATNSVTATVTISNDKITSVSVNNDYTDQESGMYIDSFMSSIQSAVVGKSVNGLSLSRIGGASLTTQAFDDALAKIRTDAKA